MEKKINQRHMYEKDRLQNLDNEKSLIHDDYYFKYIFKKTEKIVSAVFYILRSNKDIDQSDTIVRDLENNAHIVLNRTLETLSRTRTHYQHEIEGVGYGLVALQSKLLVAHAAQIVTSDQLNVFMAEIDSTLRSIRSFAGQNKRPVTGLSEKSFKVSQKNLKQHTAGTSSSTQVSSLGNRQGRIMAVLAAQPDASIKDISDTVKDCSEKTIQRELNIMIKDGSVIRNGQRRWSKYSLHKT